MRKIIRPRIVALRNSEKVEERDFAVKFYVLEDQRMLRFVLTYDDVINALDGRGEIVSKEGAVLAISELCNPGGHTDFGWLVSIVLNAAVCSGRITKETYFELVRQHFESYYLKEYISKTKMCNDFYARYFSCSTKRSVACYEQLFDRLADVISQRGRKVYVQRGGEFVGCYYDYKDRLRPRTEPKHYESLVPVAEKLWVCFEECFNYS